MAATFDKDMNIITNFLKDMDIIAALDDQPNDVGGLTAAELKAKFDEGGKAIQEYINGTLIPEVLGLDGTEASRQQAEAARVSAEEARITAESARASAEQARILAEQERAAAEQTRVQREQSRDTAEQQRIQAEQGRVDSTSGIVAQATAQAQAATQSASAAAASAAAAQNSASTAQQSAANASASADAVATSGNLAQSWAVGGTGVRPDEEINNAKYWAEKAQDLAGGGSGRKVCRFVVGTSTAGWMASDCDYLCDGTADEEEIQAAIDAMPDGGTVVLLEGTYVLSNTWLVISNDHVTIRGAGSATILTAQYNLSAPLIWMEGDYGTIGQMQIIGGDFSVLLQREGVLIRGKHCTVDSAIFSEVSSSVYIDTAANWATVRFCKLVSPVTSLAPYTMILYNEFTRNLKEDGAAISLEANCYKFIGNFVDGHSVSAGGSYAVLTDNYVSGPEEQAAIDLTGTQLICRGNVCSFLNDGSTYTGKTINVQGSDCIVTGNITMFKEVSVGSGTGNIIADNIVVV